MKSINNITCPKCKSKEGYKYRDGYMLSFFCQVCGFTCLMRTYRNKIKNSNYSKK